MFFVSNARLSQWTETIVEGAADFVMESVTRGSKKQRDEWLWQWPPPKTMHVFRELGLLD